MYFILFFSVLFLITYFVAKPVFGAKPDRGALTKIKLQPNYKNGTFENLSPTPTLPPNASYWKIIKMMLKGNKKGTPNDSLPAVEPDFSKSQQLKITWFGHSSYLIQVDQLNILVDPVFSYRPSPFQFLGTKRFEGTDFVKMEQLPPLDVVLITHDHYDHLDYQAILKLKATTKTFVTSLGVGAHLLSWGVNASQLIELAWNESTALNNGLQFTALPARHFSGRSFKRNQSLWSSFMFQSQKYKLYLGGDSGYDTHFKSIGTQYGPFDLAILECGQYNHMWPLIHMFPEQTVQASIDLNAKALMPVHWGKYKLALHDWDEPINRLVKSAAEKQITIATPRLGESFVLSDLPNTHWWKNEVRI